jgi:hypothetical protein
MMNKEGFETPGSACGKKEKDCKLHAKVWLGADSCQNAIRSCPQVWWSAALQVIELQVDRFTPMPKSKLSGQRKHRR